MNQKKYDVVIAGGGVIGSAIAYFLAAEATFDGSVLVVEKDPTYARSSTGLSVGGIRQQFSMPENIEISKFGAHFFKTVGEYLRVDDSVPDLSFREAGYLFLASGKGKPILEQNYQLQRTHGVAVIWLTPDALERRFPWLNVSDLAAGTLGLDGEGWIDPYSLLMGFKRKAESLGVEYLKDEVVGLSLAAGKVAKVRLGRDGSVACGVLVNAAGPRAGGIAAMAGIRDLPVHPRKRFVYTFDCRAELPDCPLVVDPGGVYFRPEGRKFLCGMSPVEAEDPDCLDFKLETKMFDEIIWPALAQRVPDFAALERGYSWAGHYAVNVLDRNAILGPHPAVSNFYFANGFSGHGLQQSPAVGRAISELIAFGSYQTLDLSKFCYERLARGEWVRERNVV